MRTAIASIVQDLRFGLRAVLKRPAFTTFTVLTLALGAGANTAIFGVLQAVVLRDLPYRDAERIVVLWTSNIQQDLPDGTSYLNFRDWKEQSRSFEAMAVYIRPEFTRDTLTGGSGAERVNVAEVGEGFFELLGTAPLLGRVFEAADHAATVRSVVISHGLWRQRFGSDAGVIGRSIELGGNTVTVIGVMPPGFELPNAEITLWKPFFFGPNWHNEGARGADSLVVLGRLAPQATLASAHAELNTIAAGLREKYPSTNAGLGVLSYSLTDRVIGASTSRALWLLFGSVGFVLLIACANVTNLSLARAAARRNEFALRRALGAGSMRLVRQTLAESTVLSILAAAVGLLFAWGGTRVLRSLAPGVLPRAEDIQVNGGVLLFLLATTLGAGWLAGLLPALQLSRTNPADMLREGGPRSLGSRGARRLHQGLVVAEIALAVTLLSGAGLLIRSLQRVQGADRGFDSQKVLLLQVDLPQSYNSPGKTAAFYQDVFRRLRGLPGVVAVGGVRDFFIHRQPDYRIALEGQPPQRREDAAPPLTEDQIIPGYFEAMRIPLVRGRLLTDSDLAQGAPSVVVINEEMARRFWPGQDPLGKRFKYGLDPGSKAPWKTVVGVVANMRRQRLDQPAIPYMFQPGYVREMDVAVRTQGDPEQLRQAIQAEMRAVDPSAPPYGIVTIEQRLARTVALRRLQTILLTVLAAVALVLAVIGAYGVINQSIAVRTQEIGIRMALGANATVVLKMLLAAGLAPAIAGVALGLFGSLALSRTMATFLYETSALDAPIHIGVACLLLAVTAAACIMPARRAARFDPVQALRHD
jgi:putative ABC transport system permease protein